MMKFSPTQDHQGSLQRYTFSLYLDYAGATARKLDADTQLITATWSVQWSLAMPPTLNAGCKWRVTHEYLSGIYVSNTYVVQSGWVGISGLPNVQNTCPTPTVPSGVSPINVYRSVLGPTSIVKGVAPAPDETVYGATLQADASCFVCGNPASRSISNISIIMSPLSMGTPIATGSPNLAGIHRLRFELVADV